MEKTNAFYRVAETAACCISLVLLAACAPRVINNQPLARPVSLVSIEPPGIVHLSDGRQYRLAALHVLAIVDLETLKPLNDDEALVEPVTPQAPISRFELRQILWRCGVGEGLKWFPEPQNKYVASDLGLVLVRLGRAIPMSDVFTVDPQYADVMVQAMVGSPVMWKVEIPADDEDAAKARKWIVGHYGGPKIESWLWKTVGKRHDDGPDGRDR